MARRHRSTETTSKSTVCNRVTIRFLFGNIKFIFNTGRGHRYRDWYLVYLFSLYLRRVFRHAVRQRNVMRDFPFELSWRCEPTGNCNGTQRYLKCWKHLNRKTHSIREESTNDDDNVDGVRFANDRNAATIWLHQRSGTEDDIKSVVWNLKGHSRLNKGTFQFSYRVPSVSLHVNRENKL